MPKPPRDRTPEARPRAGLRGSGQTAAEGPRRRPPASGADAAGPARPEGRPAAPRRHGLARVLSKRGLCSRSEAARLIAAGQVTLDGTVIRDPEHPVLDDGRPSISIAGRSLEGPVRRYLVLNKPRGLVTTAIDERGRDTVYRCFAGAGLPWLAPVGRLDKASEGLLLFTNDPVWAAAITDPATGPGKTYHVQVDTVPDAALLAALVEGVEIGGEWLAARSVRLLRSGGLNAWLEIVLDEGRNRQIRRLLAAFDVSVLRLVRVAVGPLALATLAKGEWRDLDAAEVAALATPSG